MAGASSEPTADHRAAPAPPSSQPAGGDGAAPGGSADVEVVRPTGLAEVVAAMGGDHAPRLLFRGGATKLDWGAPGQGADRVVDTTGLNRLLRHDPADLTATVQAGMPLAELQRELAGAGQWLALDPPLHDAHGGAATVGGVVAAADHGPRRLAHGAARDQVIGATFALADGTIARTGGNVIKNVAGYDLAKLLCGSLGTLALIVDVTVRLQPLPAASATLGVRTSPGHAQTVALALSDAQLEPTALDHVADLRSDEPGWLWMRFDGSEAAVAEQRRAAAAVAEELGLEHGPRDDTAAVWDDVLVAALIGGPAETVAAVSTLPSLSGRVAATAARAAADAGVDARWHSHVALGLHRVVLSGGDPADHAAVVRALRAAGHRTELRHRVAGVDAHVDAWTDGALPSAWPLMRSLKDRLDPDRRCAPGRFLGGL